MTLNRDEAALFENCIAAQCASRRSEKAFGALENMEADEIATHH